MPIGKEIEVLKKEPMGKNLGKMFHVEVRGQVPVVGDKMNKLGAHCH